MTTSTAATWTIGAARVTCETWSGIRLMRFRGPVTPQVLMNVTLQIEALPPDLLAYVTIFDYRHAALAFSADDLAALVLARGTLAGDVDLYRNLRPTLAAACSVSSSGCQEMIFERHAWDMAVRGIRRHWFTTMPEAMRWASDVVEGCVDHDARAQRRRAGLTP